MQRLVAAYEHPELSHAELDAFRDSFQGHAYLCRYSSCPNACHGLKSQQERTSHEDSHSLAFPCLEQGCQSPPFCSVAALNRHHTQMHLQRKPTPRLRRLEKCSSIQQTQIPPEPHHSIAGATNSPLLGYDDSDPFMIPELHGTIGPDVTNAATAFQQEGQLPSLPPGVQVAPVTPQDHQLMRGNTAYQALSDEELMTRNTENKAIPYTYGIPEAEPSPEIKGWERAAMSNYPFLPTSSPSALSRSKCCWGCPSQCEKLTLSPFGVKLASLHSLRLRGPNWTSLTFPQQRALKRQEFQTKMASQVAWPGGS